MPSKRRCPTCGSRQWRKDPTSGMIACSEGHVLESYRNESKEMEVSVQHTMRKRYLKKTGEGKKAGRTGSRFYHGAMGRFLYFQCLQALLRLQISALIRIWDLPAEFETVCRDIWAIHITHLPRPIRGDEGAKMDATATVGPDSKDKDGLEEVGSEEEGSDGDSELDRLLRENSGSSGESGSEVNADDQISVGTKGKPLTYTPREEQPVVTIAVLMVTCRLLRIPVFCEDFARIIETYELPYLGGVRLLPADMTSHLTTYAKWGLSPQHAPRTIALHELTCSLASKLNSKYKIALPEVNVAPLLWRAVRAFGGAPSLYVLARRVAQILCIPLTMRPPAGFDMSDPRRELHNYRERVPIEVLLVMVIIITLKMVYGLDGKERTPETPGDPACSLPSREDFLANLRSLNGNEQFKFDSRRAISIGDFSDGEIDEYLDFCERALVGDQAPENEMLNKEFPLQGGNAWAGGINNLQGRESMPMTASSAAIRLNGSDIPPGKDYAIWSGRDVLGVLPSELREIVRRGSQWAGVDEDYICQIVETYEDRLFRWWRRTENEAVVAT